jgi:pyrrolysyl-tRNA synthetase-like protein
VWKNTGERGLIEKTTQKVYYRKQIPLFRLIDKMKLWPSRKGILHGIRVFEEKGTYAALTTHCHRALRVRNSKKSRAARWLRNKWHVKACEECGIPEWKLKKYSETVFRRRWGSFLLKKEETTKPRDDGGETE